MDDQTAQQTLPADFARILQETETRVRHSAHAHWAAANRFDALSRITTLTTLLGGFLVSSLSALPVLFKPFYAVHADVVNISLFALGGLVSALSVLQSVQRWSERSQDHLYAANAYSSLRRKLEMLRLNLPHSAPDLTLILEDLLHLGETAPAVPGGIWNKAVRALK